MRSHVLGPNPPPAAAFTLAATLTTLTVALFLFGTAWDVQSHVTVGRDRLFTTPHVLMLAGIALAGLINMTAVLIDLRRTRRAKTGVVLSGVGALLAGVAFVLDDYWHAMYGIDVAIWAPFHVMIVTGVGTAGIGALMEFGAARSRTAYLVLFPLCARRHAGDIHGAPA